MFDTLSPRRCTLEILVFLISLRLFVSAQRNCGSELPSPLVVPIRNVTLANQVLRRGVALSIGTPPQDLAFNIVSANNTFIYDGSGMCAPDITPIQCTGMRGGSFNEGRSSTWSQAGSQDAAGAARESLPADSTNAIWGDESLQLNQNLSLKNFPVAINRNNHWDLNALGLGSNSTILNALQTGGLIASRSWSLFWGWIGGDASSQMDGSLVFGGYDAAKIVGDNFTDRLTMDSDCGSRILVTVTDIEMNLPDGRHQSIIGTSRGAAMKMCIGPETPVIAIPLDVWSGFFNHSGGTYIGRSLGVYGYGMVYAAKDVYAGSLTFTISAGLKITIPNSQLVVPDMSINSQGTTIINSSTQDATGPHGATREILLDSMQGVNANDMPILGTPFLSSAYLSVNHDAGTFTLWQSRATRDQNLVSIGSTDTCPDPPPANSTASISSSASPSSALPLPSITPGSSPDLNPLSTRVIAGTSIGAFAILSLILALALYLRHRRRRSPKGGGRKTSNTPNSLSDEQELPPDSSMRQELPWRSSTTRHELPWRSTVYSGRGKASSMVHEAPGHEHSNELPTL